MGIRCPLGLVDRCADLPVGTASCRIKPLRKAEDGIRLPKQTKGLLGKAPCGP